MSELGDRLDEHSANSQELLRNTDDMHSIIAALTLIDGLRGVAGWGFSIECDDDTVALTGADPCGAALTTRRQSLILAINDWALIHGLEQMRIFMARLASAE